MDDTAKKALKELIVSETYHVFEPDKTVICRLLTKHGAAFVGMDTPPDRNGLIRTDLYTFSDSKKKAFDGALDQVDRFNRYHEFAQKAERNSG